MRRLQVAWIVAAVLACAMAASADTWYVIMDADGTVTNKGVLSPTASSLTPGEVEDFDEWAENNYPGGPFDTTGLTCNRDSEGFCQTCVSPILDCIRSVRSPQ